MSTNEIEKSTVAAVIEVTERLSEADYIDEAELGGTGLVVIPKGKTVFDLRESQDKRLEKPRRLVGSATLTTLDSFIAHVERFKDPCTGVFAHDDPKSPSLLAVYDYHEGPAAPRFGGHRAAYAFPLSDEWSKWQALAERGYVTQGELAAYLEEHISDVLVPEQAHASTHAKAKASGLELGGPSVLAGLARNLSVSVNAEVTQATTLASGEAQLLYKESHVASVKVPSGFVISIPVFRGGLAEDVLVRLRYRPGQGRVSFAVVLHDVDRLFRHAFAEACARVEEKTGLAVFFGSPER